MFDCANGGSCAAHTRIYTRGVHTKANEFMPNGGIVVLLFVPVAVVVVVAVNIELDY